MSSHSAVICTALAMIALVFLVGVVSYLRRFASKLIEFKIALEDLVTPGVGQIVTDLELLEEVDGEEQSHQDPNTPLRE